MRLTLSELTDGLRDPGVKFLKVAAVWCDGDAWVDPLYEFD